MTVSYIEQAVEQVRLALDEPGDGARYSDADIVTHFLEPAWAEVWARVSQSADNPVQLRFQVDLVTNQEYYVLPPFIRRVTRLIQFGTHNRIKADWKPRGSYHPAGPGWQINGNLLQVRPTPAKAETWQLFYEPTGDMGMHLGFGSIDSDGDTFTLDSTPTLGKLHKQEHAYKGCTIRILDADEIQERIISSYDAGTNVVTFNRPLSPVTEPDSSTLGIKYEILPPIDPVIWRAASMRAAIRLLTFKQGTNVQWQALQREYAAELKTLRDRFSNMEGRIGGRFRGNTIDNPDNYDRMWYSP